MDTSQPDSVQQMDAFDQESDAIRTLLLVIVAVLARRSSISPTELDAVFSVAGDLVRARWGPHSVAERAVNSCREDLTGSAPHAQKAPAPEDGSHWELERPIDVLHQVADAIRTLLIVAIAALRGAGRISQRELDAVFSAGGDLVRQRWGPHSAAGIVINGCQDDLTEALSALGMHGAGRTRTGLSPASTEQRCEAGNAPPASRSAPLVAPAPGS